MSQQSSSSSLENKLIKTFDQLLITENTDEPLRLIKNLLIGASLLAQQEGKLFIKLQDRIELNASIVLLRFVNQLSKLPSITNAIQHPNNRRELNITPSINSLKTSFILLQGLIHLHPSSQNLFRSEYNLRILLNFLPPALHSPSFSPIAIPLLDLILITFIDSPTNAQLFESAGGLEILVQAMKQKALKTELRVKVLETLWAWWIDEEDPNSNQPTIISPINPPHQSHSNLPSTLGQDTLPATQKTIHHPIRPKSSAGKVQNTDKTSINHQHRGNSRIRPISLPPPTLPEEEEEEEQEQEREGNQKQYQANISDGHETPKPNKPGARLRIQPSTTVKSHSRSQSSLTHGAAPFSSSPMVKASSEGSSVTPSRPSTKPSDPASRLRLMLENTAGEFVPATPHHPRRTTRPTTSIHLSSSPSPILHKSQPISLFRKKDGQSDSDDNLSNPSRPSDDSEDSDHRIMDGSPRLVPLVVRQRRTAIKLGSNTPQRMIRHKQSASLGSIQNQLQQHNPTTTTTSSSRSRQSSEDEGVQGPGSDGSSERESHRARDPTRRTIHSSIIPQSPTLAGTQRRPISKITEAQQPLAMESSAEEMTKRLSVDTPRASRSSKTTLRASGPSSSSKASGASSSSPAMTKSSSCSSQDEQYTPKRSSTPLKPAKTNKVLITPAAAAAAAAATPMSNSNNKMGLLTPLLSPNQRFISKPLTPNYSKINHSDLELMVNGTDSDVGPSAALFLSGKKERTTSTRGRSTIKKGVGGKEEEATEATSSQRMVERPLVSEESVLMDQGGPHEAGGGAGGKKLKKSGILEKYMANSDELVRSFREIGVGFKALARHSNLP